jgi:catalase
MTAFARLGVASAFVLLAAGAPARAEVSGKALVDALNGIFGQHAGKRASHAKGVCAEGRFTATGAAAGLSQAPLFSAGSPAVTIRFSMGGGNPAVSDKTRTVRGMALRLTLPEDESMDLVTLSAPVFFARTPEQALGFLEARAVDPATGKPDPARVEAFGKANPETLRQAEWIKANPLPGSYLDTPWFGVHAFRFVNAAGDAVHGRWELEPAGGVVGLSEEALAVLPDDFLAAELESRLAAGRANFEVHVRIAEAGDPLDDPTALWPAERRRVHVGTLTVTGRTGQACDGIMFNPLALPEGIEAGPDPILPLRLPAYAESLARRLRAAP